MITLNNAKRNTDYYIKKIEPCGEKIRLMEMGFCKCKIRLLKTNLGKKDYLLMLRNFKVILRGDLVRKIWVEKC